MKTDTGLEVKQRWLLEKLSFGHHLKGHRELEGNKVFRLYESGRAEAVAEIERRHVEFLYEAGLLHSNLKFPAARFFLSPAGREWVTTTLSAQEESRDE